MRYDIDGFQLDYMDYPLSFQPDRVSDLKTTWEYTDTARKRFQAWTGIDPATLTLQVSVTAFAKLLESRVKKHEDWALWAEKDWIDFLAPMLLTSSLKGFRRIRRL